MNTKKIKIRIVEDSCVACGYCVDVCASHVFYLEDEVCRIDAEKLRNDCTQCGACQVVCEYAALIVEDIEQYSEFRKSE